MAPIDKKLKMKQTKKISIDGVLKKKKTNKKQLPQTLEKPIRPATDSATTALPKSILKKENKKHSKEVTLGKPKSKKVTLIKNDVKKLKKKKSLKKVIKSSTVKDNQENATTVSALKKFQEMGIDDRILEGIAGLRWATPTVVQAKAIPLMLRGKNVVAEARTGSGKTGAFLIPCLHRALKAKSDTEEQHVRVLILAPSKELCRQTAAMASQLAAACSREIRVLDLSPGGLLDQRPLLAELPDVVVGTPSRLLSHVEAGSLSLQELLSVVVDEADLMTTFQYGPSIERLWRHMPEYFQCFVTSATMSPDLTKINRIIFRDDRNMLLKTVVLRLKDNPLPPLSQLKHWVVKLETFDKAVFLYAMYKLRRMMGKTIIFVNSHLTGYKLRMYLGQFGLSSCLLNSELPVSSRCHIIEEFNAGKYDMIIATDSPSQYSKQSSQDQDKESGTSRGLDFQFVETIVNFDFPPTLEGYIHRVGRTARGANQGNAVSLVSSDEHDTFLEVQAAITKMMHSDEMKDAPAIFRPYTHRQEELGGFNYRAADVWRACTQKKVTEARRKELIQELKRSKKIESYFRAHPKERNLLRHDKSSHGLTSQPHLRHMPAYIIPEALRASASVTSGPGDGEDSKVEQLTAGVKKNKAGGAKNKEKKRLRKENPLKNMSL